MKGAGLGSSLRDHGTLGQGCWRDEGRGVGWRGWWWRRGRSWVVGGEGGWPLKAGGWRRLS